VDVAEGELAEMNLFDLCGVVGLLLASSWTLRFLQHTFSTCCVVSPLIFPNIVELVGFGLFGLWMMQYIPSGGDAE